MTDISIRIHTFLSGLVSNLKREEGQDLIEYALLGGLIALAIMTAVVLLSFTTGVTGMAAGIRDCIDFNPVTKCQGI